MLDTLIAVYAVFGLAGGGVVGGTIASAFCISRAKKQDQAITRLFDEMGHVQNSLYLSEPLAAQVTELGAAHAATREALVTLGEVAVQRQELTKLGEEVSNAFSVVVSRDELQLALETTVKALAPTMFQPGWAGGAAAPPVAPAIAPVIAPIPAPRPAQAPSMQDDMATMLLDMDRKMQAINEQLGITNARA